MPEDADALAAFFARTAQISGEISDQVAQIAVLGRAIDERILDLYGIHEAAARTRILGSAGGEAEADAETLAANDPEP